MPKLLPVPGRGSPQTFLRVGQERSSNRPGLLSADARGSPGCCALCLAFALSPAENNLPDCSPWALLWIPLLGKRLWLAAAEGQGRSSSAPGQILSLHSGDTAHRRPRTWRFQFQSPRRSSPLVPKFLSHSFVVVIAFLFGTGLLCIINISNFQNEFKSPA